MPLPALALTLAFGAALAAAQPPGKAPFPAPLDTGAPAESAGGAGLPAAENPEGQSVLIKEGDRKYFIGEIRSASRFEFPEEIRLKNGSADLSAVIDLFKRASKTDYDNLLALERISADLLNINLPALCRKAADYEKCFVKASDDLKSARDEIEDDLSGRILYPERYFPALKKIRDEDFKEAFSHLDSECAEDCRNGRLAAIMLQAPSKDYQALREKARAANKQCQENLLDELAYQLSHANFPAPCLEAENKSHRVCENMLKNLERIRGRVSDLTEMVYGPEALLETEAAAPCIDCVLEAQAEGPENPLRKLAKSLEEKPQCLELGPGEEKTVRSGNGRGRSYMLKRDPDGGYSIDFPVEFSVDEDYDGEASKEDAPEHYRKRVQGCLAEASPMMSGPKGEKLRISISKPPSKQESGSKDSCQKPPKQIAIGSKDYRSSFRKFAANIDCPTIVHEILHLSGLCDEYEEEANGFYVNSETGEVAGSNFGAAKVESLDTASHDFKPAYDCRPLSSNSIMSNQYERWKNVESGKNKSLLTAGQFKSLLYGSCPAKNKRFNECSRLAYESSQTSEKEGCLAAKSRCESENALGLDKAEEEDALQGQIQELERRQKAVSETVKSLQTAGILDQTMREHYKKELKYSENRIKDRKKKLSHLPPEMAAKDKALKELAKTHRRLSLGYKTDREEGLLDETWGDKFNKQLTSIDESLRKARARLKTVQSWPEP